MVKIKVGPTQATILMANQMLLKELADLCSYQKIAERQKKYSKACASGAWDGRVSLLNRLTGGFPSGLVPRVVTYLKEKGYEVELEKNLPISHPSGKLEYVPKLNHLRTYQQEAVEAAIRRKRGIIQIPTGGGKTEVAAGIIAELKRTTLFFVPTLELLSQTKARFEKYFPDIKIGIIGDGTFDPGTITIATVQTVSSWLIEPKKKAKETDTGYIDRLSEWELLNKKAMELLAKFNLVIFDECHHLAADTFFACAQACENAEYLIAMSATAFRDDNADLVIEAGSANVIYKKTISDLVKEGWLLPAEIHIHDYEPLPPMNLPTNYSAQYDLCIVENDSRNDKIMERAVDHADKGRQVLILCREIDHIDQLHKHYSQLCHDMEQIHGKTKNRDEIIQRFKDKKFPILIASGIFDEGVDIPNLDVVILAGGGRSRVKSYQRIGRALRTGQLTPYQGDKVAIIEDFHDEIKPFVYHYRERMKLYEAEPCFTVIKHKRPPTKREIKHAAKLIGLEAIDV